MTHQFSPLQNELNNAKDERQLGQIIFAHAVTLGFDGVFITGLPKVGVNHANISNFPQQFLPPHLWHAKHREAGIGSGATDIVVEHCKHNHTAKVWHGSFIDFQDSTIDEQDSSQENVHGIAIPVFSDKGKGYVNLLFCGSKHAFDRQCREQLFQWLGFAQLVFQLLSQKSPDSIFSRPALTPKSKECLHFMTKGLSNVEIASLMSVSKDRVKELVSMILNKLEASNRTEAVMIALTHHLI